MKKLVHKTLAFLAVILITGNLFAQQSVTADEITMGPAYANEVYYSMQTGVVSTFPRNSWDIAFRSMVMSSSIITNDGSGVMLYTYPHSDTTGWATVDTAGMQSWKPMYNGVDDWENGAFGRNATGGLDFGWGVYNTSSHYITGDSLFVIMLRDGSFKKLRILVKKAGEDIYTFTYANLDGTSEQSFTLNCNNYLTKEFVGYSLEADSVVDFQPERSSWDILFTKYEAPYSQDTLYTYTGILSNSGVYIQKFLHVNPDFVGYNPYVWDSTRLGIGHNWKTFTGSAYILTDSLAYFVKNKAGDVYKFVLTRFEGGSTGKIAFNKSKIAGVGINDQSSGNIRPLIFPNPSSDRINVSFIPGEGNTSFVMTDLSGKTVFSSTVFSREGQTVIDASGFQPGVYLLKVSAESHSTISKVIITR